MELGTSKLIISPSIPLRLCGYGNRSENFSEITEDIFLRIHYWKSDKNRVILVYADLLWWNPEFVYSIRKTLFQNLGIPEEHIIFIASHNHSGPGTGNTFTPLLETSIPEYTDFLSRKVTEGIIKAEEDLEEVCIKRYNGTCKMNVYRRVQTDTGIQMQPNYTVPADSNLTIFGYYKKSNGSPKGFAVHYPCHANLSNGNTVHPDYTGVVLRMFDEKYSNCVSIFLQGCTADLRPNSVLGEHFISCEFSNVVTFAERFFCCCEKTLKTEAFPVENGISVHKKTIKLPLVQKLSKEEVKQLIINGKDIVTRQWAQKAVEKNYRNYEILEITRVDFGSVPLFFFNAEMSQYYAELMRKKNPHAVCVAYANGMIGYVCTEKQIKEGGYEPCGSAPFFALCGTYKPDIEKTVIAALENLYSQP
ncbi:alkaline ceramidase [Treponema sp. OMZ 840]|uniref:hypothetical protein n=1 Tax=Treponema sp. OMZ 840 TaxID=244313 RepID=UPI003D8DD822